MEACPAHERVYVSSLLRRDTRGAFRKNVFRVGLIEWLNSSRNERVSPRVSSL